MVAMPENGSAVAVPQPTAAPHSTDTEIFTLEVYVHSITSLQLSTTLSCPAFAFRLLDFPAVVVLPASSPCTSKAPGTIEFEAGKSCLFELSPADLAAHAKKTPLFVMLLEMDRQGGTVVEGPCETVSRLEGSTSLDLTELAERVDGRWVGEEYPLFDLMGCQVGMAGLSLRISGFGSALLPHLQRHATGGIGLCADFPPAEVGEKRPRLEGEVPAKPPMEDVSSVVPSGDALAKPEEAKKLPQPAGLELATPLQDREASRSRTNVHPALNPVPVGSTRRGGHGTAAAVAWLPEPDARGGLCRWDMPPPLLYRRPRPEVADEGELEVLEPLTDESLENAHPNPSLEQLPGDTGAKMPELLDALLSELLQRASSRGRTRNNLESAASALRRSTGETSQGPSGALDGCAARAGGAGCDIPAPILVEGAVADPLPSSSSTTPLPSSPAAAAAALPLHMRTTKALAMRKVLTAERYGSGGNGSGPPANSRPPWGSARGGTADAAEPRRLGKSGPRTTAGAAAVNPLRLSPSSLPPSSSPPQRLRKRLTTSGCAFANRATLAGRAEQLEAMWTGRIAPAPPAPLVPFADGAVSRASRAARSRLRQRISPGGGGGGGDSNTASHTTSRRNNLMSYVVGS